MKTNLFFLALASICTSAYTTGMNGKDYWDPEVDSGKKTFEEVLKTINQENDDWSKPNELTEKKSLEDEIRDAQTILAKELALNLLRAVRQNDHKLLHELLDGRYLTVSLFEVFQQNNVGLAQKLLASGFEEVLQSLFHNQFRVIATNIPMIQLLLTHHLHPAQLYFPIEGPHGNGNTELVTESAFWATTYPVVVNLPSSKDIIAGCYKKVQNNKELLGCLYTNKYTKDNIADAQKKIEVELGHWD
jgi:hypothetical protein